ncbi:hypothetical protein V8G54_017620 [Vigna mungo]|uniref:Protein kinase domain-containing protein n=1 Tax=Vigna mungo TaxID=3915 RepID=A0AAQ3NQ55_VIGMU
MGSILSCFNGLATMGESDDSTLTALGSTTDRRARSESPIVIKRAKVFSYIELAAATKHFRSRFLLGRGGSGSVYKGRLKNGQDVAVKVLEKNSQQKDGEFVAEVEMLSLLYHPNLVTLIGYCCECDQRLLVYEYTPLGSLENHLFDLPPRREPLDWNTRMKIASGVAKGLEYLEFYRDLPVMFGELKSSNILLDEGYHPKLSYFATVGNSSHVSTGKYEVTGKLTPECNVYGLGVVLLELISGRKAIDKSRSPETCHLVKWAQPILKDNSQFYRLVDPLLHGIYPEEWVNQTIDIAAMCLHEKADRRPAIREVVFALTNMESKCDRRGGLPCAFFYPSLGRKETGLEKERKKGDFERGNYSYAANIRKQGVSYVEMLKM